MKQLRNLVMVAVCLCLSQASARDWYISAERGKGRDGTLEEPSRDLGVILSKLENGDRIFIAAGSYTGRGDNGVDDIDLAVEIYGGWNEDFSVRDPWGAYRTILTGVHNSDNFETDYRLSIDTSDVATKLMEARGEATEHKVVVDGLIIDNGPRNYYAESSDESLLIRQGTPSHTPSPESGGLRIRTGINSTVIVQNVIVMNTAPTQGAFAFFPGRSAQLMINNNVAVNNTGIGFHLGTNIKSSDEADFPAYTFENNIAAFHEKHDAFATYGGSSLMLESGTSVSATGNVFALNDYYGVDNAKRAADVVLSNNLFVGNLVADYLEFDTKIDLVDIEDYAELLDDAGDNSGELVQLNVSPEWAAKYYARTIIDRNAAEQNVRASNTYENAWRSMLGLNLQGGDLALDSDVWLPRISLDDAFAIIGRYADSYGVFMPAAQEGSP